MHENNIKYYRVAWKFYPLSILIVVVKSKPVMNEIHLVELPLVILNTLHSQLSYTLFFTVIS